MTSLRVASGQRGTSDLLGLATAVTSSTCKASAKRVLDASCDQAEQRGPTLPEGLHGHLPAGDTGEFVPDRSAVGLIARPSAGEHGEVVEVTRAHAFILHRELSGKILKDR